MLYTDSLLEREPDLSERTRASLRTIQQAVSDVAETVARMREFYRPTEAEVHLTDVDLNTLVQQVANLTRARWNDLPQRRGIMIELKTRLAPDLPGIRGAENEIRDALTNLVFNAVDAMPEGGTIEITTSAASGLVQLAVRDTGIGMDEETRRRCLEPFFTTKGKRGTGLGLAMVYGMAQRHDATVDVESQRGVGTTLRLEFPAYVPSGPASVKFAAEPRPSRALRILLVDDDPSLIHSLRSTLESDGHFVTAAEGGQAGIDAFQDALRNALPFEVVITDLGMPYVDGRQVIASVRSASPRTPVILLTGWGQQMEREHEPFPQVERLLAKPPRLRELRAALAELT
jgi:CheY-like chemotaxis protein